MSLSRPVSCQRLSLNLHPVAYFVRLCHEWMRGLNQWRSGSWHWLHATVVVCDYETGCNIDKNFQSCILSHHWDLQSIASVFMAWMKQKNIFFFFYTKTQGCIFRFSVQEKWYEEVLCTVAMTICWHFKFFYYFNQSQNLDEDWIFYCSISAYQIFNIPICSHILQYCTARSPTCRFRFS